MTLIFSNENRILFNRENANQLLELNYGNRVTPLKKNKVLLKFLDSKKLKNSSHFECVKVPAKSKLFFYARDAKYSSFPWNCIFLSLHTKGVWDAALFPKGTKVSRCTLHRGGFTPKVTRCAPSGQSAVHRKQIFDAKSGVMLPLISFGLLKITTKQLPTHPFALTALGARKRLVRKKTVNTALQSEALNDLFVKRVFYIKKFVKQEISKRFFSLKNMHALLYLSNKVLRSAHMPLFDPITMQHKSKICEVPLRVNPSKKGRAPSEQEHGNRREGARRCNYLSCSFGAREDAAKRSQNLCMSVEPWRLKKKIKVVELLVPNMKVRDLAFGSSFLLLIMAAILQRQHQNSWCFHFLRSQTPGFYNFSRESSLQCFENITDQYLNRKETIKSNLKANQIKHIDFYKDQFYIDFSKPWNQQLNQDFAAVFSKDFSFNYFLKGSMSLFAPMAPKGHEHDKKWISSSKSVAKKWIVPPLYKMHARIPNYSLIADQTKAIALNKKPLILKNLGTKGAQASPACPVFTRTLSKRSAFAHKFNLYPSKTEGYAYALPRRSLQTEGLYAPRLRFASGKVHTNLWYQRCASKLRFLRFASPQPFGVKSTRSISEAERLPNEAIKNKIFNENDTIPSKMSCSVNPIFTDNSKVRLEKQKKNFEKRKNIGTKGTQSSFLPCSCSEGARPFLPCTYKPSVCKSLRDKVQRGGTAIGASKGICFERENDVLKKFFYDYGLFSISTKALQLKKIALSAKDAVRSSGSDIPYKQEDRSASEILPNRANYGQDFDLALMAMNFENLASIKNFSESFSRSEHLSSENDPRSFQIKSFYTKSKRLQKHIGKVSCDILYNTGTLCNRLMSGYKMPETHLRTLHTKLWQKSNLSSLSTKYRVRSLNQAPVFLRTGGFVPSVCNVHKLNLQPQNKNQIYIKIPSHLGTQKLPFYNKIDSFTNKPPKFFFASCSDCHALAPKEHEHGKKGHVCGLIQNKNLDLSNCKFVKVALCAYPTHLQYKERTGTQSTYKPKVCMSQDTKKIRALKKVPYKKLSLNEYNEVKPLFEKINQGARMSPHKVTFKKPLFTDYNDYLSWHKDSPTAISISPSLEEDRVIDQSWDEHLERESLVNQNVENRIDKSHDKPTEKEINKENNVFSIDLQSQAVHDKSLNEEEKKREITKWEWLHNVRESEFSVEERKNLRKLAYQNKEALLAKHLKPKKGTIQNFLVSDRKLSFFGITNIFPKRLIAKDQKQINNQILQGDYDRRSVEFFESANNSLLTFDPLSPLQIEQIFSCKSKIFPVKNYDVALKNLNKANTTYVWKQGNSVQVTKGDPLYELRSQDIRRSKLQIVPRKRFILSARTLNVGHAMPSLAPVAVPPRCTLSRRDLQTEGLYVHGKKGRAPSEQEHGLQTEGLYVHDTNQKFVGQDLQNAFINENGATIQKTVLQTGVFPDRKFRSTNNRQHSVYRPSRRLRLRVTESSKGNYQSQSRADTLNLYQSHRWWQKRRLASSLLGAPSKCYMVLPEITKEDWKKIIEWQLKTYFLEEEKRLQPLILERIGKTDFFSSVISENRRFESDQRSQLERKNTLLASKDKKFQETLRDFKIKKVAVYLPWITLKKPLKKPFEWPLTRLTYPSPLVSAALTFDKLKSSHTNRRFVSPLPLHRRYVEHVPGCVNKKPDIFLVSAISPFMKPKSCKAFRSPIDHLKDKQLFECTYKPSVCKPCSCSEGARPFGAIGARRGTVQKDDASVRRTDRSALRTDTFLYKPFLFEMVEKEWYLVIHQLLLAIAIKQILKKIYHLFGKIIRERVKNSSLEIAFLKFAPFFFNGYSRENQVSGIYKLKTRLKDLIGSEDSISSLSQIVWYLRNSCRGRLIPRGVVLLENNDSESTEVLKAIAGEAQVPVIVQSLRALPFTQNHPQRRLEKILKFAEKQAPCILFLDDLDSIGKSRTLLINQTGASGGDMHALCPKGAQCNFEIAVSSRNKKIQIAHMCPCLLGAIGVRGTGKDKIGTAKHIANPLLNRANFSVGSEKAKWKNYRNSLFFKSKFNSRFQRQNFKVLHPAFTNVKALRVRSQSLMVQNGCHANTLCPYGATKSKISAQTTTTLIVPETEKLIEQRKLDLMLRLLTVMDGISHLKGVLIVTTSKNPSSLDPALLRPGRFEKFINIKLPHKKRRIELLKVHTLKIGHSNPIPWENLGVKTESMTGAAIADAINHSAFRAIIESTPHTLSTLEYGLSRVNSLESKGILSFSPDSKNDTFVPGGQKTSLHLSSLLPHKPKLCVVKNKFASFFQNDASFCHKRAQQEKVLHTNLRFVSPSQAKDLCNKVNARTFKSQRVHNAKKVSLIPGFTYKHLVVKSLAFDIPSGQRSNITRAPYWSDCHALSEQRGSCSCPSGAIGARARQSVCAQSRTCPFLLRLPCSCPFGAIEARRGVLVPLLAPKEHSNRSKSTYKPKVCITGVRKFCVRCNSTLVAEKNSSVPGLTQKLKVVPDKQSHLSFSQISFYQAGQGIICNLFKQEKLGFQQYQSCGQNLLKSYAGYAAESIYIDSICSYKKTYARLHHALAPIAVPLQGKEGRARTPQGQSEQEHDPSGFDCHAPSEQEGAYKPKVCMQIIPKNRNLDKINFTYLHVAKCDPKGVSFIQSICDCKTAFNIKPRKYFQFYQSYNFYAVLLKQKQKLALAQNLNRNQNPLLQAKTCETLQNLKRSTGHWYRLYLPKIERNRTNREWLIPDKFANQHISLLNLNYIKQNEKAVMCSLNFLNPKIPYQPFAPIALSHFVVKSKAFDIPFGQKPKVSVRCVAPKGHGHVKVYAKQRPLALSCFYVAFHNLSEHRELLDLLADHLIRFHFVRLHEILRISLFYVSKS